MNIFADKISRLSLFIANLSLAQVFTFIQQLKMSNTKGTTYVMQDLLTLQKHLVGFMLLFLQFSILCFVKYCLSIGLVFFQLGHCQFFLLVSSNVLLVDEDQIKFYFFTCVAKAVQYSFYLFTDMQSIIRKMMQSSGHYLKPMVLNSSCL